MKNKKISSLIIMLIIATAFFLQNFTDDFNSTRLNTENAVSVTFLDVGQGDSALIRIGNKTVLVDGSEKKHSERIADFLISEDVNEITYLIATHPHADHIGGLSYIIKNFDVKNIYMPKVAANTNTFLNLLDAIEAKGLMIDAPNPGDVLAIGDAKITFFAPIREFDDLNNSSIVFKLVYGKHSFLFTGDAEKESENDILNHGFELKSTVIKVPHHGSSTSSTKKFISAVQPDYAVISAEKGNSYGHPHAEVIDRYKNINSIILQTMNSGNITFISDGEVIKYETER